MIGRVLGLEAQMPYSGVATLQKTLTHSDHLSRSCQCRNSTYTEAKNLANYTITTLQNHIEYNAMIILNYFEFRLKWNLKNPI